MYIVCVSVITESFIVKIMIQVSKVVLLEEIWSLLYIVREREVLYEEVV